MSRADLRLVLLLVLLVFTSAIFAACRDAPVAPDTLELQAITKASAAGSQGLIYVSYEGGIHVLDAETNAQVDLIDGGSPEVSPDSKTLWVGRTVYQIPRHTVKHQFDFPVSSPDFSVDGRRAYVTSGQELLTIDTKSFQVIRRVDFPFSGQIEVSPTGDEAYVVSGDYLQLVDALTGTLIEEYYLPALLTYDVGYTSIGRIKLKPDGSELWMPMDLAYGNGVFDTQARTFAAIHCGEEGEVDFLPDSRVTIMGDTHGSFCVHGGLLPFYTDGLPLAEPWRFDVAPDGTFLAMLHRWGGGAPLDYPCVVKAGFTESAPAGGIELPGCSEENYPGHIVIATPGREDGGKSQEGYALDYYRGYKGAWTADANALDLTSTWTVEGWVKPSQPEVGTQCIVCKWGGSSAASYGIAFENDGRFADGRFDLVIHDPSKSPDNTKIFSTGPFPADEWTHFALVFDNGGQSDQGQVWLYINGVLDASCGGALGNCYNGNVKETVPSVAYMNTPQVTTTDLSIGFLKGLSSNWYQGVLDEFRIWNVARSASDIANFMNKRLNLRKVDGLVAYWRMNEGKGQVASDETGNGHDLTLGIRSVVDWLDPAWVSSEF